MAFGSDEALVRFDSYVDEIGIGRVPSRSGGRMTSHTKGRIAQNQPTFEAAARRLDEVHRGTPKRRKPKGRRRGSKGKGAAQRRAARRRG